MRHDRLLTVCCVLVLTGCAEREWAVSSEGSTSAEDTAEGTLGAGETSLNPTGPGEPTTTQPPPSDGPPECAGLGEEACVAQNHCDWLYGQPIDIEAGCLGEHVFLACLRDVAVCTGSPTVVCAGGAAVLMGGGCTPPGFVPCDEPVPVPCN
jgi:hypothetical protein